LKRRKPTKKRTAQQSSHTSCAEPRANELRILSMFGKVDFDPQYDYKAERGRKRSGGPWR
jgi:hypothetical protein